MTNDMNRTRLESIVDWIEDIRRLGCASFADVALRLPEVWSAIRADGATRRTIAQSCGWPLRLSRDEIHTQPAERLGVRLLNFGTNSAISLWQYAPRICHLMHVEGKLHEAYAFMCASVRESEEDEAYILDDSELQGRGFLEAALRLDFEGIRRTLAFRGEAHLRHLLRDARGRLRDCRGLGARPPVSDPCPRARALEHRIRGPRLRLQSNSTCSLSGWLPPHTCKRRVRIRKSSSFAVRGTDASDASRCDRQRGFA